MDKKLIGWCCIECEKKFYLEINADSTHELGSIKCPYCGEIENTVMNTIKKEESNGVRIPIKNLNINYENTPMETIKPIGKYRLIGESIGKLVDEKNKAYGDSFNKSAEFLKILFPNGVPVESYSDMLGIIRVFDKLMRIATNKDALGENPWKDICGYSILRSESE